MIRLHLLATALLLGVTFALANPIDDDHGGSRVMFPEGPGWSQVQELRPNSQSIQWIVRHNQRRRLYLYGVVNAPIDQPGPDAPFSEHAAEWLKTVVKQSDSIESQRFVTIAKRPAFEVTGTISNAGETHHFIRVMMQLRHITYQATILSREKLAPSDKEVESFLNSIEIPGPQRSEPWLTNQEFGFRIDFPSGPCWSLPRHESAGSGGVWTSQFLVSPQNCSCAVTPMTTKQAEELSDRRAWSLGLLEKDNVEQVSAGPLKLGDTEAYHLAARSEGSSGNPLFVHYVSVLAENRHYLLRTVSMSAEPFGGEALETFVKSFRLIDQTGR